MVKRGKSIVFEGYLLVVFGIPFLFSWFIAFSVIVPTIIPNASATESFDKNTSSSTTDKGYSLSISVPKTVTIDLIPNPNGSFSYSELNTQVTTTNPTGYSLSFNASDGTGSTGNGTNNTTANTLINTNTNITTNNTIPSITSDTNQSSFPTNSWGYSINDNNNEITTLTFKPIPLPSSSSSIKTIKTTNIANASGSNTKLILGIKADNSLASGTYRGQLTFTSVANYKPNFFPETLTTMQGMTSAICSSVDTPTADATIPVTNKDQYTDPTTQVPQVTLTDTRDNNTYIVRKLADGNCWMVQNLRLGSTSQTYTLTPIATDMTSGSITLAKAQAVAAEVETATMYGVTTTGNYEYGNLYNQPAALAGSYYSNITAGADATASICPKNWRLPSYNNNKYNIVNLLENVYSVYPITSADNKIFKPPLDFVLSGSGTGGQGQHGALFIGTVTGIAAGNGNIWKITFAIGDNTPVISGYDGWPRRQAVRCVAR